MRLEIITPSTAEPLTIEEVKDQLRIEQGETGEDNLLRGFIRAARTRAENYTGRTLMRQTKKYYIDNWPVGEYIEIPDPPLIAIQSSCLTYVNSTGETNVVWSSGDNQWEIDKNSEPGRLYLKYGEDWPNETLWNHDAVRIQFICGYGTTGRGYSTAVPENIKLGMKMLISHWYENRENTLVGQTINKIPDATEALWSDYRVWRFEGWHKQ